MCGKTYRVLYPEARKVTADVIVGWYKDAVANEEVAGEAASNDIEAMIVELEDSGLVAVAR
jgi:hypothetical protein